jgi:quercetin dioxygenase-like cupin family protein
MVNAPLQPVRPELIPVPGGKVIEEYFGRVASGHEAVSVARMVAPPGWDEPVQTPQFDEYTVVLEGELLVESGDEVIAVPAGHGIFTPRDVPIRYRTETGATYVAICLPAFSVDLANRDE